MIRELKQEDFEQLKQIHEKYYKNEFTLDDFYKGFLCAFAVVENDVIISAGGVRLIAESVLITNKDVSVRARKKALIEILQASQFICSKHSLDQLHCFIQDNQWKQHLEKYGFKECIGKAMFLNC